MKSSKADFKDLPFKLHDGVKGRRDRKNRANPLSAARNKFSTHKKPDSQEYLLGDFIGIQELQAELLPEIMQGLKRAEAMEWDKDLIAPAGKYADDLQVVNYGSFKAMYAAVFEPWLGEYESLKADWNKHLNGDLSLVEVKGNLEERKLGNHGGDRKSTLYNKVDNQGDNITLKQWGTNPEYLTARIARDRPDIHERMKAGEYKSVRAAAKDAGIVREATPLEKATKAYLKLSESEKQKFYNWITKERETMD